MLRNTLFLLCCLAFGMQSAQSVNQLVGDVDGFGIEPNGQVNTNGTPADIDGDGIIENGEFLPDWDRDGRVAVNSLDSFDNRSLAELSATNGAQHTDFSIVGSGAAHNRQFIFNFSVPQPTDVDYGVDHFINFVFGDYDVFPASIVVDGQTISLTLQGGSQDGLVQMASAVVPWSSMLDGQVVITILARNEPYLAFDYALLDTDQIKDTDQDAIPDNIDNCPFDPNFNQEDSDQDGIGDACDDDADNDGITDDLDNCINVFNPDQQDSDSDGLGDVCDSDSDNDGVDNDNDSCPNTSVGPVNPQGCSIEQTCQCDADWKNHGAFMSCVAHESEALVELGIISEEEKDAIVSSKAQTNCGKKRK